MRRDGNQIVSTLSRQLTAEDEAGFSRQDLLHVFRFVEAEYLSALPDKNLLAAKLHDAVIRVREQLTLHEQKSEVE